jgi:hypothetical protein
MRILPDESPPRRLRGVFTGHDVVTVVPRCLLRCGNPMEMEVKR